MFCFPSRSIETSPDNAETSWICWLCPKLSPSNSSPRGSEMSYLYRLNSNDVSARYECNLRDAQDRKSARESEEVGRECGCDGVVPLCRFCAGNGDRGMPHRATRSEAGFGLTNLAADAGSSGVCGPDYCRRHASRFEVCGPSRSRSALLQGFADRSVSDHPRNDRCHSEYRGF